MTAANRYEMSGSFKGVAYSITLESSLPDDECDPSDDLGGKVLQAVTRVIDAQVKALEPVPSVTDTHYSVGLPACGIRACTWHTTDASQVTCPICLALMAADGVDRRAFDVLPQGGMVDVTDQQRSSRDR